MLENLSEDELFGREIEFNPLDYALTQAKRLQRQDYDFPTNKNPSLTVYPDDEGDVFSVCEPTDCIFHEPYEIYTGSDYGDVDAHTNLLQSSPSKID